MQTIYAKFLQRQTPMYRRELLRDRFNNDKVAYDFLDAQNRDAPCLVVLHGLEGSSHSHYAVELMLAAQKIGWNGVVAHFRGCGGVITKKTYHSGDSEELNHMLQILAKRYCKLYVVGVSLGGNVLAKYLGERKNEAIPFAAAVVSAPVNLSASSHQLSQGLSRIIYTPYFLKTLMKKVPATDVQIRNLSEFDNVYTAPLNGFIDKDDYYMKSSALPYLKSIMKPTLLLNAKNDPFFPGLFLPTKRDVSEYVYLLQPEEGGHVGFVSGSGVGNLTWLPETVLTFFQSKFCDIKGV